MHQVFLSKCEVTADDPVVHQDVSKQVIGRWRDDQMAGVSCLW